MSGREQGYSLVELLVSLVVFSGVMGGVAAMLVESSRVNKSEQLRAEAQSNARNTLALIVAVARSAGWDPAGIDFEAVAPDGDTDDEISELRLFADLNADGDLEDEGESVTIRHSGDVVEWRTTPGGGYLPLAANIGNDADGDGTPEPMFTLLGGAPPTSVLLRVTAESPVDDPRLGAPYRYTLEQEIALRGNL